MNINLKGYILGLLSRGEERSVAVKRNALLSIIFQGSSMAINFILVPMTLDYLNPVKFGIWAVISSVITWFTIFDLGLGNSLKNKLTESLANKDYKSARLYISSIYAAIAIIAGLVFIIFIFASIWVNWGYFFNIPRELSKEVNLLIVIVFSSFLVRFVLNLINIVYISSQLQSFTYLVNFTINLASLAVVFTLGLKPGNSLLLLGAGVTIPSIIILLLITLYSYKYRFPQLAPSLKEVDLSKVKGMTGMGLNFFVIQIIYVIIFMSDNFIISKVLGPQEVTPYNIAYKYFTLASTFFSLMTAPLWAAFTSAYVQKDFAWIQRIIIKATKVWIGLFIFITLMVVFSGPVYQIWIQDKVTIPIHLSVLMGIFVSITTLGSIFTLFLNALSKIRIQLYYSIIVGIINIPLSIYFAKYLNMGSSGVILATSVCLAPTVLINIIQYRKIINNTATGLWGK